MKTLEQIAYDLNLQGSEITEDFAIIYNHGLYNDMKTNTQHTPGPWKTSTGENLEGVEHRWISNGNRFIADLGKVGGQVDSESNARLIAAAPELLAFAQMIANGGLDALIGAEDYGTIEAEARAAIIKATGGQP